MSVSRDLGKRNILVNTILPGPMMTGMTEDWSQEKIDRISKETRLNRLCEPMEVANVINFLLSNQSSFMTASIVDMTAGSLFGH
jgi:NAD(P)-dependent dehydrogenase (short-subunit alcohol dehydrogenase family)